MPIPDVIARLHQGSLGDVAVAAHFVQRLECAAGLIKHADVVLVGVVGAEPPHPGLVRAGALEHGPLCPALVHCGQAARRVVASLVVLSTHTAIDEGVRRNGDAVVVDDDDGIGPQLVWMKHCLLCLLHAADHVGVVAVLPALGSSELEFDGGAGYQLSTYSTGHPLCQGVGSNLCCPDAGLQVSI